MHSSLGTSWLLRLCGLAILLGMIVAPAKAQNLFAANYQSNTVSEYSRTGTYLRDFANASTGVDLPTSLAFDANGNLYVAESGSGVIGEYAPDGTYSPFATGLSMPYGLAFDAGGSLFVYDAGIGDIIEYPSNGTPPFKLVTGLSGPEFLAFDKSGNLYVANYFLGTVSVYAPDGTALPDFATGLTEPCNLAFDASGNLYVDYYNSNNVSIYKPDGTRLPDITAGLYQPAGLAFDTSGNLYVANYSANNIGEYSSAGAYIGQFANAGMDWVDAIAFSPSPSLAVNSISVSPSNSTVTVGTLVTFTVTATYVDGTTGDVTLNPSTTYTVTHGSGTLSGTPNTNIYAAVQAESAVITVSYTSGGATVYATADIAEIATQAPTLTSVNPNSAPVSGAGASVLLTGTNFAKNAQAMWNGAPLKTVGYSSSTGLQAQLPTPLTAGVFNITVVNPGSAPSNALPFTVTNPVVSISATPKLASVVVGVPDPITVIATFADGTAKDVSTDSATVYFVLSGNPTGMNKNAYTDTTVESAFITVTYAPSGGGSAYQGVSINEINWTPFLTAISPSSAPVNNIPPTFTLAGTHFVQGASVQWGSTTITPTKVTPSWLTFSLPAGTLVTSGSVSVTASNPGTGPSNAVIFTFTNPVRSIRVTVPNSILPGTSSATVTVGTPVPITVVATYADGTTQNVSSDPATTFRITHGTGTLSGNTFTGNAAEAAVIGVSYTSGGGTASNVAYINVVFPHGRIVSSLLTPHTQTLAVGMSVTFSFTVTYADGTTADVSTSGTIGYSVSGGHGSMSVNTYTATGPGAPTITAVYTDPTTGQVISQASYLTEIALVKIAVTPVSTLLLFPGSVTFSVSATYSDGSTKAVTGSAAYTIQHGVGVLSGHTYTSIRPEAAVIGVSYTEGGKTVSNVAYVTTM